MRRQPEHQRWDDADADRRVRVLLECEPSDSPSIVASTIERAGYDVRTCTGPDQQACDLDRHGACGLVDGADVVVNLLRGDAATALAARIAQLRRPPGVVVEVRADGRDETPDLPGPVVAVRGPVTRRDLLRAIEAVQG